MYLSESDMEVRRPEFWDAVLQLFLGQVSGATQKGFTFHLQQVGEQF